MNKQFDDCQLCLQANLKSKLCLCLFFNKILEIKLASTIYEILIVVNLFLDLMKCNLLISVEYKRQSEYKKWTLLK